MSETPAASLTFSETPERLLKGALEKIVFFEARSTQLSNDLAQATSEVERLKGEMAAASQREIELRRVIAELEVRTTRAHSEREEFARLNDALRRERTDLVTRMLDASRVHGTETIDGFDLAQFIAQLRSEVLITRNGATPAEPKVAAATLDASPAPVTVAPLSASTRFAHELKSQGRLTVSEADVNLLTHGAAFPGRTEETLFGFSVRELSAPDPASRVRAAERLTALAQPAAAPALATALHAETEASVQVALLTGLAKLAKAEAVPVVQPLLTSPVADVRIAALKALLTLDAKQAGPHLAAATKDPDKSVRRRASLLALGLPPQDAIALGTVSIRDADADVRALAALVLGASHAESARPLLLEAMRDEDLRVRRAASQALSSVLGKDVTSLVDLDDAHRRREVRRLSTVQPVPLAERAPKFAAAERVAPKPMPAPVVAAPVVTQVVAPVAAPGAAPVAAKQRVAVVERVVEQAPAAELQKVILTELRTAIRGRQLPELASAANVSADEVMRVCGALLNSGAIVRRGHKYFVA